MKKLNFTLNLIPMIIALLSTLSIQSMEKKDNKHINESDYYSTESNTAPHNSILLCSSILTYNHKCKLPYDGSNNDLLGHTKNDYLYAQSSSHHSSTMKKYINKDNLRAKTEAELLINSDYNEMYNEPSIDTTSNTTDTELFY